MPTFPARCRLERVAAAALVSTAGLAAAQTPPVKPGLWEVRSEREVAGQKAAPPAASLDKLPPEVRAKVEASLREKGVALGAGGVNRICMTKETLDPSHWQGRNASCKTEYSTRNASVWKWHASCTQPASESDGEAVFASPESYTVKTSLTMTLSGRTQTSQHTLTSRWLGADCGNLKPFSPQR